MSVKSSTGKSVSAKPGGNVWEESSRCSREGLQLALDLIDPQANWATVADGYEVLRRAVAAAGGQKRVALEMGKGLDYGAKISEGLARTGDRRAQWEWVIVAARVNPEAGRLLAEFVCAITRHEPPVPRRVASDAEMLRACMEVLDESGAVGESVRAAVARKLGADIGAVRK